MEPVTWLADNWLSLFGWAGSALLIASLLQARVLRFRVLNLIAGLMLVAFNALLGVWPMVGMNLATSAINVYFIRQLVRARTEVGGFQVVPVRSDNEYLAHILKVHAVDISRHQPDFTWDGIPREDRLPVLIQRGDETVGVVILSVQGERALVVLDYVTKRFRDFSPGEYVWRESGLLTAHGIRTVVTSPSMLQPYYARLGFRPEGNSFVLELR